MPHELVDLDIEEVSGVDAAANKRTFLVIKRASLVGKDAYELANNGDEGPPLDYTQRGQQAAMRQEFRDKWSRFCETVWEIMDDDGDDAVYAPILLRSIEQFQADVGELLTNLGLVAKAAPLLAILTEVQKAGAVMSSARRQRLQAAIAALQAILDEADPKPADPTPTMKGASHMAETLEGITKRAEIAETKVGELEKANAALTAELAQLTLTPEEQEATYLKSLPEAVRKQFEADRLEKAELRKALAVEKEQRERGEYIQKTATYRLLGITPDHWNILKAIDGLPEADSKELLRLLASASEVVKQSGLLKTLGREGSATLSGGAGERIEKAAKEKATASDGKLSYYQAYDQVVEEHPDWLTEYRAEQKGRA